MQSFAWFGFGALLLLIQIIQLVLFLRLGDFPGFVCRPFQRMERFFEPGSFIMKPLCKKSYFLLHPNFTPSTYSTPLSPRSLQRTVLSCIALPPVLCSVHAPSLAKYALSRRSGTPKGTTSFHFQSTLKAAHHSSLWITNLEILVACVYPLLAWNLSLPPQFRHFLLPMCGS